MCVRLYLPTAMAALAALAIAGCDGATSTAHSSRPRGPAVAAQKGNEELIQTVADNLNHLEEFEPSQILPQVRDRLNQWVQQQKPAMEWQPDSLLDTLPPELRKLPVVQNLGSPEYSLPDMASLQEAICLRDIARVARGSQVDDLAVALQLFDWTVRNLQLEAATDADSSITNQGQQFASEVLLLGRGTARERAWVFLLLLRQRGLDGVMFALPAEGGALREWVPAVLIDKELYLFDPELGLPVPGPEDRPVATLAEVLADDGLLRKLDLSSQRKYRAEAGELQGLAALVDGSPSYLSRRMKLLESRLTGQNQAVLSARPEHIAERLKAQPSIAQVRLWTLPYEVWQYRASLGSQSPPAVRDLAVFNLVPALAKGRALEFKGIFDGEKGAKAQFLRARRSNESLARSQMHAGQKELWALAKQDASYWLGLIALEQQKYPVAIDYFARRSLENAPGGPWSDGARYNLARVYEASGELDKAIELLQSDSSPQKHGNRLRARRLKAQLAQNADTDARAAQPEASQ